MPASAPGTSSSTIPSAFAPSEPEIGRVSVSSRIGISHGQGVTAVVGQHADTEPQLPLDVQSAGKSSSQRPEACFLNAISG